MNVAKQKVRNTPVSGSDFPEEERRLRAELILEETLEYIEASGFRVAVKHTVTGEEKIVDSFRTLELVDNGEPNVPDMVDAIGDAKYVLDGAALALGVDMEPIEVSIHSANMAKFGPESWTDRKGKVRKPPGWSPPDIEELLTQQGS